MTRPVIKGIAPFFVVRNAAAAVAFYWDKLGFEITYQEPEHDPFFAIVCRGSAMLILKAVEVDPRPNPPRDPGPRGEASSKCLVPMARRPRLRPPGVPFSDRLRDT